MAILALPGAWHDSCPKSLTTLCDSLWMIWPHSSISAQRSINLLISNPYWGVEIIHWRSELAINPSDIVIEAFACELPDSLKRAMSERTPASLWINLEYLSAESWVEGCHRLPSPQMIGPDKYFFFPGFAAQTGGLLRESDLISRRECVR